MKKIIGIVSEYNPFHSGHQFHIEESRKQLASGGFPASATENDTDYAERPLVICCMSGDFVQRGEWAILSKHERAALAVRGGADLVVELPLPWSLSSAERFAESAVHLLAALGTTHLSFGSESGNLCELLQISRCINSPGFQDRVAEYMKFHPEQPYASARGEVLEKETDGALYKAILESPNNLLGVEYLRALQKYPKIVPMTVQRRNSSHDGVNSAMELRTIMRSAGEGARDDRLNLAALSRLRTLDKAYFSDLPDGGNGAGERIYAAVRSGASSVDGICQRAKTRSIPFSRLRRVTMRAVLGLTKEFYGCAHEYDVVIANPPYIRILAASARGRQYLAQLRNTESCPLPVVTLPKEVRHLDAFSQKVFAAGVYGKDFYNLGFPEKEDVPCGEEWRLPPVML